MHTLPADIDPARDLDPDPHSPAAQQMLTRIVAMSPPTVVSEIAPSADRGRYSRPKTRFAVGGLLAAATAAAVLASWSPWSGSPHLTGAYAVTRHEDGTVQLAMRWSELQHPGALQQRLDQAHAPVLILTGKQLPASDEITTPSPVCSTKNLVGAIDPDAVHFDSGANAPIGEITIDPGRFRAGVTLVFTAYFDNDGRYTGWSSSFVTEPLPTCGDYTYGPIPLETGSGTHSK